MKKLSFQLGVLSFKSTILVFASDPGFMVEGAVSSQGSQHIVKCIINTAVTGIPEVTNIF